MTLAKSEQRRDDPSPAQVPGVSVTRRVPDMNTLVKLPIAGAVPTAAPAATLVPEQSPLDSKKATSKRRRPAERPPAGKKKSIKKKRGQITEHSEIVMQCTIYAQSIAAYEAGFYADRSLEGHYAGGRSGPGARHYNNSQRALLKLNVLAMKETALTDVELFSKTRVFILLMKSASRKGHELVDEENVFLRLFGLEVERYVSLNIEGSKGS
jgi:hypothetical protein